MQHYLYVNSVQLVVGGSKEAIIVFSNLMGLSSICTVLL